MAKSFRIGVDIGGTFTDIVFLSHDGQVHTRKVPSTVDDYGRGIVEGVDHGRAEPLLGGERMRDQVAIDEFERCPEPLHGFDLEPDRTHGHADRHR